MVDPWESGGERVRLAVCARVRRRLEALCERVFLVLAVCACTACARVRLRARFDSGMAMIGC